MDRAQEVLGVDADRIELLPKLGFGDALLEWLAHELLAAARGGNDGGDGLYADHLARAVAVHLLRRHGARAPRESARRSFAKSPALDRRIRRSRELIESALAEDLALERLARESGIGTHAFRRRSSARSARLHPVTSPNAASTARKTCFAAAICRSRTSRLRRVLAGKAT
jgi:hypothetical protein